MLTRRVLNRTLLTRQRLLERSAMGVPQMCEHLVGLQAQDMLPPFVGLWNRISAFDPGVVSAGLQDRSLARITLMRGTIHLVTARDALRIAPHIQAQLEKIPFRKGFHYGATVGMDPEQVRGYGDQALGTEPVAAAELRCRAQQIWPDRDGQALLQTWLYQLPVMQTPPRGMWRRSDRPIWARTESWLGAPFDENYHVGELILRYLRAFGPATTSDMQTWSRLTGLREIVAGLGDQVRSYASESGGVRYDVVDGELADPDCPAPVRFLGWFDNVLLSHKDRRHIIGENPSALSNFAVNVAAVLVDGYVSGWYKVHVSSHAAIVKLLPLRPFTQAERAEIMTEAMALLGFLEPEREPQLVWVRAPEELRK